MDVRQLTAEQRKELIEDLLALKDVVSIEESCPPVTVVLWTSSHILYGLPLHQKGDVSKATC